jgi:glucose/arabinose dehydrogenase
LAAIATAAAAAHVRAQGACSNKLGSITVPAGFCIEQVADSLNGLRHIAVGANGDLYAATQGARGGLIVLHDTNGDGRYDTRSTLYTKGGNDVVLRGANLLYYTTNDAILRITTRAGDQVASVDTIVQGLPTGGHTTKSIAFDKAGALYVDIGSPSNSCQVADRTAKSPGKDPCAELETRAGVWKFDATKQHQTLKDGSRYATGLRNVVALTSHPTTGVLYGVQHGRDQLADNWGFTAEQSAEIPSEILARITEGSDFGWPYCYHDRFQNKTLLAPEYGGDGKTEGRCASKTQPIAAYPGHWAPESIVFYNGTTFPAQYRGGAFIAFHGSWNRSPLPQAGFNVIYQPFTGATAAAKYTVFAEGFNGEKVGTTGNRVVQPMGLAVGPDGALYIGSDTGARVWRVRPARAR